MLHERPRLSPYGRLIYVTREAEGQGAALKSRSAEECEKRVSGAQGDLSCSEARVAAAHRISHL